MAKNAYYLLGTDWDVIDAAFHAGEGAAFCRWLAMKYLLRAGKKAGGICVGDLSKATAVIERWKLQEEYIANGIAENVTPALVVHYAPRLGHAFACGIGWTKALPSTGEPNAVTCPDCWASGAEQVRHATLREEGA